MIVTLVGQMGAGKSTVGRLLAERWADRGFAFVDLDAAIETAAGARIAELFATYGEADFRAREAAALAAVLAAGQRGAKVVLATGGGAPCQPGAMELLLAAGPVLWLDASPALLAGRALGEARPLLAGKSPTEAVDFLAAQREARRPHYERAPWHVAADGSPAEVAAEIDRRVHHLLRELR